ncbi:hypothetical protein [Campylobacter suis]|uniref:Protein ADP-ribosyltransferase n=1 Tax=Campylobacter suis TaxID=2790657 RepID=A0ABM8Q0K5_9BACT|nr:hypothetical protein [Campylobacter suis]CAD7286302.1 Protein ADP-ribosyltransferase [Campylobacter suis]
MSNEYKEKVAKFLQMLDDADAVCIGIASGMSASCGYTFYYQPDRYFKREFGEFERKYGWSNAFDGLYYPYKTREERWAFLATMVHLVLSLPVGQNYFDLKNLLAKKPFIAVTTNQDRQLYGVFDERDVVELQGDWKLMQCDRQCCDEVWDGEEMYENMYANINECKIPSELVPKCPNCGGELNHWVRSRTFLQGTRYANEYKKWRKFLDKHSGKKVLFLELGVGRMTPMFIQEPFWQLVFSTPKATYVTINPKDAIVPREIKSRSLAIGADISKVFRDALKLRENKNAKIVAEEFDGTFAPARIY